MGYKEMYEEWLNNPYFDDATKAELKAIEGNEKEIEDRFYMDLEFGTAGLRGVIGAGTNRMNVYTVRKATQGLANYINNVHAQEKGVAIPDICRRNLQMLRLYALLQTELRRMCSSRFVRHRNFPMQSAD